jgi:CheY-like chemotaxis protein
MADLLLVDDDIDMADLVAALLRDEGHVVRVAGNGRQGLDCLDERFPDAVLLDVDMPVVTGPEMAYRMFLVNLGREKIPIVLFSAEVQLAQIAARVGTPYFCPKPHPFEGILAVLGRALTERAAPHRSTASRFA